LEALFLRLPIDADGWSTGWRCQQLIGGALCTLVIDRQTFLAPVAETKVFRFIAPEVTPLTEPLLK
jgi:hypothetical protein